MKKKLFLVAYVLLMGFILFNSENLGQFGTALEYVKCGTANGIPKPVPQMTSIAFTILIVGTPIVLIVFSIIAMVKAISSGNPDDVVKVRGKLLKKIIATVVIFLLAGIARFAINKVATNTSDKNSASKCISCFLYNSNCEQSDSGNDVQ